MRTTLDIDDDVLSAVKSLADSRQTTAGKVISELARKSLLHSPKTAAGRKRNGFVLMPRRSNGKPVTMEMINKLRDEE